MEFRNDSDKTESVISKNPDLSMKMQKGETCSVPMDLKSVPLMKFTPITSVEVEISFSALKNVLSDNLKKLYFLSCNK